MVTDLPTIAPAPAGVARPFWSVMIPTYEPHPGYLAAALTAVLAQDPGAETMEIVLVDDASRALDARDCVPASARSRVAFFRHESRVGIARNWNACLERAHGVWVHLLHQDDLVLPGFYERLRAGIETAPEAGAAFCRDVVIDGEGRRTTMQARIRGDAGIVDDWIDHVAVSLHLRAAAVVVKRAVYEALGGFRLDLAYALDWDMWKRIATAYPLWYEPEILACYRRHAGSASFRFMETGANIAEIRRSIELSEAALGSDVASRARERYTGYAVEMAWQALRERRVRSGWAQIREARRLGSIFAVTRALGRRALLAARGA